MVHFVVCMVNAVTDSLTAVTDSVENLHQRICRAKGLRLVQFSDDDREYRSSHYHLWGDRRTFSRFANCRDVSRPIRLIKFLLLLIKLLDFLIQFLHLLIKLLIFRLMFPELRG